jgi:thiamine-phosphate pyrophosphorylase
VSLPAKFPQAPILCYVTDHKSLPPSPGAGDSRIELLHRIAAATTVGVDWIQIREKDFSAREISRLVRESLAHARHSPPHGDRTTRILVNGRLDVGLSEKAGGVHLGENSLPVRDVAQWIGSQTTRPGVQDFLIGVSCHSLAGAIQAERDGADYIFFGPVFVTPSKADFGAPQGLEPLREVCKAVSLPVLAIGGVALENAASCLEAGAAGLAAIRLFQDAPDLATLIEQLRTARSWT